jgi:beta-phosphoglucomutase-like phosphatase (HAD superfamily)
MAHLREEQPYLESKFNDIVTANRISRSKPDPEGYLLGAKICNADPKNCVVIEDSVQGVTAGHRAGCLVIGLTTTVSREKLEPYSDIIVNTLADLNWDEIADTLRSR